MNQRYKYKLVYVINQINLKKSVLIVDSIKDSLKQDVIECQSECDQLVAIFHKTVATARSMLKVKLNQFFVSLVKYFLQF